MKNYMLAAISILSFVGCNNDPTGSMARSAEARGLRGVQIGDPVVRNICVGADIQRSFNAKDALGNNVEGVVCCGFNATECTAYLDK